MADNSVIENKTQKTKQANKWIKLTNKTNNGVMSTSQVIIYQIDKYMVDRSNNMLQKQDIKILV